MNILGFGFYKPPSLKNFVMKIVNETVVGAGTGKIFTVSPRASFASVPVAERSVTFEFSELTSDSQLLNVQGVMSIVLLPETVTKEHDFTIDLSKKGAYVDPYVLSSIDDKVVKMLQSIARTSIQSKTLTEHMNDVTILAKAIPQSVIAKTVEFQDLGVQVKNVFVDEVSPDNEDVSAAFEAVEREKLLTLADKAVAQRRMQSAEDDRKLREYEAETAKKMEDQRTALIAVQSTNLAAEATAKADANKKQLDAYAGIDAGVIYALGILEFAKSGRVGTLNISPELLEAFKSAANKDAPKR